MSWCVAPRLCRNNFDCDRYACSCHCDHGFCWRMMDNIAAANFLTSIYVHDTVDLTPTIRRISKNSITSPLSMPTADEPKPYTVAYSCNQHMQNTSAINNTHQNTWDAIRRHWLLWCASVMSWQCHRPVPVLMKPKHPHNHAHPSQSTCVCLHRSRALSLSLGPSKQTS